MSDLHHVWRPCQLAEEETLSTSLACEMLLSAFYHGADTTELPLRVRIMDTDLVIRQWELN